MANFKLLIADDQPSILYSDKPVGRCLATADHGAEGFAGHELGASASANIRAYEIGASRPTPHHESRITQSETNPKNQDSNDLNSPSSVPSRFGFPTSVIRVCFAFRISGFKPESPQRPFWGVSALITKPFDKDQLLLTVKSFLSRKAHYG